MNKAKSYEDAVSQLEKIVNKLEAGDEGLDEAMKLFEEGAELSVYCYKKLETAQQKITELSAVKTREEENE